MSTNLHLVPRLRSCGTYRHSPDQLQISFQTIYVLKNIFSWNVAPCIVADGHGLLDLSTAFITRLCLHFEDGDSRFLRNICTRPLLSSYAAPHPRRPYSRESMTWRPELTVCPVCKWISPVRLAIGLTCKRSHGPAASGGPLCLHKEAATETTWLNVSS